ncbi:MULTISPECIES: AraC family transcriptional regulator [Flavobacterium]|uniref:AraC family transcriptional regulator n=1 Tax=Flavobacterium faecale TaxID=1355330 RepID=A0A2S1LH34_9FLAO|nr:MULTISPECIES: response regulator transcription factor [Flavobacterium]AWG22826.1 AraC family transcriptional regulator [Flavobacterium faecale]
MIMTLLHIDLNELPVKGLDVQILNECTIKKVGHKAFLISNTAVLLIKSGSLRISFRDVFLELFAHDLVVLSKGGALVILETDPQLKLFYLSFSTAFAIENCNKQALLNAFYFLSGKSIGKVSLDLKSYLVVSLIYKLMYQVNSDKAIRHVATELQRISFNLFLYELRCIYGYFVSDYHLSFTRNENLTIQFLNILAIHFKEQHRVQFYAGVLYVTAGYLNKVVKQTAGKPVKRILEETLIMEAKNRLDDDQITINRLSEELGFNSPSSFSTFFKKHVGIAPSVYRSSLSK